MPVFLITFAFSALLLVIFIVLFVREQSRKGGRGIDHESLLPLEDETPKPVTAADRKKTRTSTATQENESSGKR